MTQEVSDTRQFPPWADKCVDCGIDRGSIAAAGDQGYINAMGHWHCRQCEPAAVIITQDDSWRRRIDGLTAAAQQLRREFTAPIWSGEPEQAALKAAAEDMEMVLAALTDAGEKVRRAAVAAGGAR